MNKSSLKKISPVRNSKFLNGIKEQLEKKKKILEEGLQRFAKKNEKLKGDWNSQFPKFDGGLEEGADEVEEYSTRLSIEYSLENRLQDINLALEKIKKGRYGKCEKCRKEIPIERLRVCPEAKTCSKCK